MWNRQKSFHFCCPLITDHLIRRCVGWRCIRQHDTTRNSTDGRWRCKQFTPRHLQAISRNPIIEDAFTYCAVNNCVLYLISTLIHSGMLLMIFWIEWLGYEHQATNNKPYGWENTEDAHRYSFYGGKFSWFMEASRIPYAFFKREFNARYCWCFHIKIKLDYLL